MPAPMRAPWDNKTPQPRPRFEADDLLEDDDHDGHELSPTEDREGVFKPRDPFEPGAKKRRRGPQPTPEPMVAAPKCDACGRRRRSVGPCWYCGDELQVL